MRASEFSLSCIHNPDSQMKLAALYVCSLLLTLAQPVFSQSVIIPEEINLPKDSIVKKQLINALNGLIVQKGNPVEENKYVLPEDVLAVKMLLAELKGAEKNIALKDDSFFKPYLINVAGNDGVNYRLQLNYMGANGSIPMLKSSFRLMTKLVNGQFIFILP